LLLALRHDSCVILLIFRSGVIFVTVFLLLDVMNARKNVFGKIQEIGMKLIMSKHIIRCQCLCLHIPTIRTQCCTQKNEALQHNS
jgi:hypothetical protein